ncbi:MAG: membrane protein insertase YidC [Bacteroidetes bacterium]|nr:MAG: membrane protein insertase YidC [Bacteroidota bacterium]REK06533.1 MAG: membrane protein insertase YidC [Bacteroidota bacterium]REK33299.1 MAG: membrane protein insertase YidC [Bacteroidota bacterium]
MDRNSLIGLSIIGLLIVAYTIYTQPSQEELAAIKHRQDSISAVNREREAAEALRLAQSAKFSDTLPNDADQTALLLEKRKQELGAFADAAEGIEQIISLENNLIKVDISSKGGRIRSVELKNYKTWDGHPVKLMSYDSLEWNLTLSAGNRIISTQDLYFSASGTSGIEKRASMRLQAGEGKYLEYLYSLKDDSYLIDYRINVVGMQDLIAANTNYINLDWKDKLIRKENNLDNERAAATIYYRFADDEVDYISETSDEKQSLKTKVKWIAFKQHFFTVALIADQTFDSPVVETFTDKSSDYVKNVSASFALPYEHKEVQTYGMRFYAGPNHYQTLKKIEDLQLEKLIPLGWGIFGWVNKFLVIPTFNYLNSFNLNFGIIILILTILVRVILLPLTYGSFKSQAKMKVLQPEMTEINEKFKDDPLKKQQEMMGLYKKAGVNPLGGCIPGLLQLPILIAMFRFFPSSIELRQESFLWADDLSTYDNILDLPFHIPFYGAHVSLFTLLMTISTIIYTRMNMQMTAATNPQMKWMLYLMPIFFLGFFNNYSSGLSYYYFLSNIFGFGQQYLFKFFIDEDKIHRQIQENKKKPVKKSAFQTRLETMAKERGLKPPRR